MTAVDVRCGHWRGVTTSKGNASDAVVMVMCYVIGNDGTRSNKAAA